MNTSSKLSVRCFHLLHLRMTKRHKKNAVNTELEYKQAYARQREGALQANIYG